MDVARLLAGLFPSLGLDMRAPGAALRGRDGSLILKTLPFSSGLASPTVCQNCVELDSATLAGIVITDIIATVLLALGVYCFAGHETGRFSRGR